VVIVVIKVTMFKLHPCARFLGLKPQLNLTSVGRIGFRLSAMAIQARILSLFT
jgi:hypothetical protein